MPFLFTDHFTNLQYWTERLLYFLRTIKIVLFFFKVTKVSFSLGHICLWENVGVPCELNVSVRVVHLLVWNALTNYPPSSFLAAAQITSLCFCYPCVWLWWAEEEQWICWVTLTHTTMASTAMIAPKNETWFENLPVKKTFFDNERCWNLYILKLKFNCNSSCFEFKGKFLGWYSVYNVRAMKRKSMTSKPTLLAEKKVTIMQSYFLYGILCGIRLGFVFSRVAKFSCGVL